MAVRLTESDVDKINRFLSGRGIPLILITIENGELAIYAQKKERMK